MTELHAPNIWEYTQVQSPDMRVLTWVWATQVTHKQLGVAPPLSRPPKPLAMIHKVEFVLVRSSSSSTRTCQVHGQRLRGSSEMVNFFLWALREGEEEFGVSPGFALGGLGSLDRNYSVVIEFLSASPFQQTLARLPTCE